LEKDVEKKHNAVVREINKKFKMEEMKGKKNEKREKKEEKSIICPHCSAIITLECKPSQKIVINCPICGNKGMALFKSEERKFEKLETEKTDIQNGKEKKHADKLGTYPPKIPSFVRSNIIGLALLTIGVIFLSNPTIPNIKISFTLILIGFILIFILPEESSSKIFQMGAYKPSSFKINHKYVFRKSNKRFVSFKKKHQRPLKKVQRSKRIWDLLTRLDLESLKKIKLSMSDMITLTLVIWIIFLFFITGDTELEVFFVLIFIGMLVVRELTDELTAIRLKHRMDGFIYVFLVAFIWIIGEKIINVLNM
jgi:hypothetical protein